MRKTKLKRRMRNEEEQGCEEEDRRYRCELLEDARKYLTNLFF